MADPFADLIPDPKDNVLRGTVTRYREPPKEDPFADLVPAQAPSDSDPVYQDASGRLLVNMTRGDLKRMQREAPATGGAAGAAGNQFATAFAPQEAPDPALQAGIDQRRLERIDPGAATTIAAKGAQGLTLGFSDEILAGAKSGFGMLSSYDEALKHEREILSNAGEARPWLSAGSEIAGGIAGMVIPGMGGIRAVQGAGLAARVANAGITGAAYGGVYGAGTAEGGLGERATGAAWGAGTGALTGSALPVLGAGIGAAGRAIINPIRGAFGAEREASRRVAGAFARDNVDLGQAGGGLAAARAAGVPATVADRGGETVRALARSSANTSPEGRGALVAATDGRMESQKDRFFSLVRGMVGNANATQTRENLQAAARRANRPAYARAYRAPGADRVWDGDLEQLASAPVVQDAIRMAGVTGRNRAALDGFPPIRNPFVVDRQTGRLTLAPPDAQGRQLVPTLQFWDHVKRNLDDVGTREARQAARVLREHLDQVVPAYQGARSQAARFFNADNALEAGENFVTSRVGNEEARRVVARMSPAEQALFREGFASRLIESVREAGDRTNVINSIFLKSPASRERISIALGAREARGVESFLRVENCFDLLRRAVQGNSTTARQLAEIGLAGGAGAIVSGGDITSPSALFTGLALYTARRGTVLIDQRVARRVGEMLASDDPAVFQQVIALASRNASVSNLIRATEQNLARLVGPAQSANAVSAEDAQQPAPGPGQN